MRWQRRDYRRVQPKLVQITLSLIVIRCEEWKQDSLSFDARQGSLTRPWLVDDPARSPLSLTLRHPLPHHRRHYLAIHSKISLLAICKVHNPTIRSPPRLRNST